MVVEDGSREGSAAGASDGEIRKGGEVGRGGRPADGGGEIAADRGRCWRPAAVEVAQQKEMEGLGEGEEARRGWEEGGKARR